MNRVWSDSKQKGSALLLMLALADYAADDGYCWPKTDTLADKIRMSTRTVYRLIDAIEQDGELYVVRKNRNNRYVITLSMTREELIEVLKTRKEDSAIGDILSRDTCVTSIGDTCVTSQVTQLCHPNHHEPSWIHHEEEALFSTPHPGGNGSHQEKEEKSILEFTDPLAMAAEVARRRGDIPDWAVPDAGGPSPYYPALLAFCKLTQRAPPDSDKQGKDWLSSLEETASYLGIDADECANAIDRLDKLKGVEWFLERGVWSTPHADSFKNKLGQLIGEIRAGTFKPAGGWERSL